MKQLAIIVIIVAVILASVLIWRGWRNKGTNTPVPSPAASSKMGVEDIKLQERIKQQLASSLENVTAAEIEIVSIQKKQWPNSCLGINRPATVCAQVITPGYLVKALAVSRLYEIHTDLKAQQIIITDQDGKIIN